MPCAVDAPVAIGTAVHGHPVQGHRGSEHDLFPVFVILKVSHKFWPKLHGLLHDGNDETVGEGCFANAKPCLKAMGDEVGDAKSGVIAGNREGQAGIEK